MLDVTGWHVTWIQANKRAEGKKNIKGTSRAFAESFQKETMASAPGEKSDPAGMFILDRKEAVIVITSRSLFHCKISGVLSVLTARRGQRSRAVAAISLFSVRQTQKRLEFFFLKSPTDKWIPHTLFCLPEPVLGIGNIRGGGGGGVGEGVMRRRWECFSHADITGSHGGKERKRRGSGSPLCP